ncbi:Blastoderm-specific protein 25D [Lucilia cuprina]|uniref:Blastoderm-specific protein 25D n=1 Tax=Lucilia cuprina TaxID=7375 RepID=A0A0L0C9W8_LUCCU|nr:Blastoderm-specific protein 25D [Lucilia cuprina]KNC29005.1 Blastoderm-specific protein 25D [Lucilia cuprina]
MEFSADPYEYKLYQMFQSCDTNQCGFLDENSLRRLCAQLELRDKGAVLIENLAREGRTSHVTFENFKEALLNFLGTEIDGANTSDITGERRKEQIAKDNQDSVDKSSGERALIISEQQETFIVDSPPESPDREVSPKLVVGTKKYGRRSRPHTTQRISNEQTASDSDDSNEEQDSHRACSTHEVKRSTSQTDIPGSRRRCATSGLTESKLKRCASLPAQRNLFNTNKPKLVANKGSLVKDSLVPITKNTLSSSVESLGLKNLTSAMHAVWSSYDWELSKSHFKTGYLAKESPGLMETLPINSILDIWERAAIPNGRGILLALGFDNDEINIAQLNKVMEEEISNLEDEPQMALMKACLVLQTEELGSLRQFSKQLRDENAKLRADNKDANRRISLLAAEIDERHASLEDATKKEIRLLEQRHAGVVRDLTARLANDRENWCNLNTRLESKLKIFEQEEIKIKTELELVRRENEDLEGEKQKMQKQITELLEKNIELQRELTEMDETNHCERRKQQFDKSNDDEEVLRLVEKVSTLQVENCNLRDKNDELIAEVENLNHDLNKMKMKWKKLTLNQDVANQDLDENEMSSSSTATKRRGDSPSKTRLIEESPRLGKLRKCTNDANNTCSENSDTSGEWMALNSELNNSQTKSSEIETLRKRISELEEQLQQAKEKLLTQTPTTSSANVSHEERCKELEASLEQMQKAYEECEDYWQAKLTEERTLFEKERQIYEEEQQESDKKFTELMEKVREYEEQFSKDGRLSPIEEKDALEQQYADLEAEAEEIRENARKMFEEKSQEIEALQNEIEDLRVRLGESVEILTGAYELKPENVANNTSLTEAGSPANSPISYLWHQSTIQEPAKNCQPLETNITALGSMLPVSNQTVRSNLSTSETTIFSTTPLQSPIEKPTTQSQTQSTQSEAGDVADCETSSTASGKSFETHSIHSNQSYQHQQRNNQSATKSISSTKNSSPSPTPSVLKDELKRLKYFEISLKEQIKDLSLQRDGLIMELQQLQEAKPVLEKAYARTSHPSLIQRVNQLELKNRHLQNVVKQQQQYTESIMQQSWRHHQIELNDLHGRLEAQGALIAEQVQRLHNADILVKDLYVENSHLTASVQRLEQQRVRANMLQQQQQQRQSCTGLPGIP